MSMEILAPAGSFEQLRAAVCCGADAVYLGTDCFNARPGLLNMYKRIKGTDETIDGREFFRRLPLMRLLIRH